MTFDERISDVAWLERLREAVHDAPAGRVGPYELVCEVSRGGQGVVYRSRQPGTNRPVALKRLIGGRFATRSARARFEREIESVCALSHPNIVTVFGVESIDGQPVLAMEWIDGLPLDIWARGDANGVRPLRERLRMFLDVCDAVQHAHQRGVIHRDLKPSNVLVSADGSPHVLDFGLARPVVDDDSAAVHLTFTAEFVGTPAYAAPEQVSLDRSPVDSRTDVYSLGAILYQILCNRTPHDSSRGLQALLESIRTVDPARPSTLASDIDRDLDLVTLKALARDPGLRYQSVDALSADLRRYLAGEPVLAHPPSTSYQLRKLLRRHRWPAAFAATVLVLLIVIAVVASTLALRIAGQRDRAVRAEASAQARFDDVRQLARAMIFDVHEKLAPVAGATEARRSLVETSLKYLDRLSTESGDDPDLQLEIAEGYHRLGAVQGLRTLGSLGDLPGALDSFSKMQTICQQRLEHSPDDVRALNLLAGSFRGLGDVLTLMGRRDDALSRFQEQLKINDRIVELTPNPAKPFRHAYVARLQIAKLHRARGDDAAALDLVRQAQAEIERQMPAFPDHTDLRRDLALSLASQGDLLLQTRRLDEAEHAYRLAKDNTVSLVEEFPDNDQFRRDLAVRWQEHGDLALARKDHSAALAAFAESLRIHQDLADADPANVVARRDLSIAHEKVGDVARLGEDWATALIAYESALAITSALAELQPDNAAQRRDVCLIRAKTAGGFHGVGKHERSVELLKLNLGELDAMMAADAADTEVANTRLQSLQQLADAQLALNQFDDVRITLERYHTIAEAQVTQFPAHDWRHRHRCVAAHKLGTLHERLGNDTSASPALRQESLQLARDWYERGRSAAFSMRDAGLTAPHENDIPDEYAEDVARCDRAIQSLTPAE